MILTVSWTVHGNFRLSAKLVVKVSDFGLAGDMYTSDYYRVEDNSIGLPIRWMSTEAIQKGTFSTPSDVVSINYKVA